MVRILIFFIFLVFIFCENPFFSKNLFNFSLPIVVITFDDAHESVYKMGYKLMREEDTSWAATHFFCNSYIDQSGNVTLLQVKEMENNGWESGGHGLEHDNLTAIVLDSVEAKIRASYNFLISNNLSHESFAWAFGAYNDTIKSIAKKYFKNIRTSHDFYYLDGIDRLELGYFAVKSQFTANDIIARIEEAKRLGAPLVIIGFHVILPDTAKPIPIYWCKESVYKDFLKYLKKQNITPVTIKKAMQILKDY